MKNKFILNTKKEFENLFWLFRNINNNEKQTFIFLFLGAAALIGINLYIPFIYKEFISKAENEIVLKLLFLFAILYTLSLILNYIFDYISSILSYKIDQNRVIEPLTNSI